MTHHLTGGMAQPSWRRGAGRLLLRGLPSIQGVMGPANRRMQQPGQPVAAFASSSSSSTKEWRRSGRARLPSPGGAQPQREKEFQQKRKGARVAPPPVAVSVEQELRRLGGAIGQAAKAEDIRGAIRLVRDAEALLLGVPPGEERRRLAALIEPGHLAAVVELCAYVKYCDGPWVPVATKALLEVGAVGGGADACMCDSIRSQPAPPSHHHHRHHHRQPPQPPNPPHLLNHHSSWRSRP